MSLSSDTAPPADMTTAVQLRRDGAVAHFFLARPQARNALNLSMCLALRDIFETLDADDDVAVITISAEGPVFCAGADLKERQGKDETWVRRRRIASFVAYAAIERCNKPTVAFIEGPVIGSGGEISMACDFIVASTAASFRFPEPQQGTVDATQRLQRVIGKRRAKELLFTGRTMPAEEAHGLGLIARLVEPEQLPALREEILLAISKAPPLSMRLTKQAIDLGEK